MTLSDTVLRAFGQALSPADVISDPVRCRAYECDGLTGYRVVPELVLLPRDAGQVAAAVISRLVTPGSRTARRTGSTTPPIRPASRYARSVATSRRTPAARPPR